MGIGSSGVVNCANTYLGTANYTVADGYVADRTVIVDGNGPAQLNLNFARDEVLDPRITFSRTSNATRVNAQGLIEYAPHNLLTYSEQFDNAAWNKPGTPANILVDPNVAIAPDGTTTADKIIDNTTTAQHLIYQFYATTLDQTYTYSIYAKMTSPAEWTVIRLQLGAGGGIGTFDLSAVTASTANAISASITPVGNGWFRCSLVATSNGNGNNFIYKDQAIYTGDGTSGIYLWGAQLNEGALQPYYSTTVKNLLGYSQDFTNAAWTKSNSTIDATPVMGPFGYLGAMKLVEDTAVSSSHRLRQILAVNTGTPVTISVYAKAGERNTFDLFDAYSSKGAYFNLTNGVASAPQSSGLSIANNVSIDSLGGDWYRCSITVTTATTSASFSLLISNGSSTTYTGDGTSGIYIYGAQLSDSASLDPYSYNTGAAPTSTAYYGPRFDYDPVTLAPKGLLIEEQRINILLNSDTLSTQLVSVTAQAYTLSFYGTGSVALSGAYTGSLVGTGAYPNRVQLTFTPIIGILTLTVTGSVRYANLEAGSFPTSYIPTTSAQVTRAADNASMTGTNFSSWYNQSEGTIFAAYSRIYSPVDTKSSFVVDINDTTLNNRMGIYGLSNQEIFNDVVGGLGLVSIPVSSSFAANTLGKLAGTYKLNDFAAASNGILGTPDTSGTLPTVTQIRIGDRQDGVRALNGHLKSFKYFNKRLLNSYLQSLTQ